MSEAGVEVVRRVWGAAERGDLDGFIAGFAPDVSWDMTTATDWPEPEVHTGRDTVREFMIRWVGSWDDFRSEVVDVSDVDGEVVLSSRDAGRGKASGLTMEQVRAHRIEVRDGLIQRVRSYASKDDALAAIEAERG